jgi:ferredoxin
VIDVCKLKTHLLTGYTGAVKNMFGILPGRAKNNAHHRGNSTAKFCNVLLDVYSAKMPKLCLMDGIIGMEGNGPAHGKAKKTGLIIASRDGVALDMVASRIIGYRFKDLDFLKIARERDMVPERIRVQGVRDIKVPYKKPLSYQLNISQPVQNMLYRTIKTYFNVQRPICRRCKRCMQLCPQKAIGMRKGFPVFDKNRCIMCYCCHELCPHGAIVLKKPLVLRIGEKLFKSLRD